MKHGNYEIRTFIYVAIFVLKYNRTIKRKYWILDEIKKGEFFREILHPERILMRNIKGYASLFVFFIIRLNVTKGIIREYILSLCLYLSGIKFEFFMFGKINLWKIQYDTHKLLCGYTIN